MSVPHLDALDRQQADANRNKTTNTRSDLEADQSPEKGNNGQTRVMERLQLRNPKAISTRQDL